MGAKGKALADVIPAASIGHELLVHGLKMSLALMLDNVARKMAKRMEPTSLSEAVDRVAAAKSALVSASSRTRSRRQKKRGRRRRP